MNTTSRATPIKPTHVGIAPHGVGAARLLQALHIIFALVFTWILFQAVVKTVIYPNTFLTCGFLLLYLIVVVIARYCYQKAFVSEVWLGRLTVFSFFIYLTFLLIVSHYLALSFDKGTWDFHVIARDAYNYALNMKPVNVNYYARYPNNLALLTLLVQLFSLILFIHPHLSGMTCSYIVIIFNCLCIFFSTTFAT